ncbi:MAG: FlgD immunoglobulin-like domain containing protein, partial [bacterium]
MKTWHQVSPNIFCPILFAAFFLSLATLTHGQVTVVVDGNTTYQTIRGWGGNAYSWVVNGWNGWTNNQVFNIAFNKLGTTHVRVVTEFERWEPVNDDDDPSHFNWSYYQSRFDGADISSRLVQGDFNMMDKVVNDFRDHLIIGIWDVPNWMVEDSTKIDHRNLPYRMHREFAESVAAYLLWARDRRGIKIDGIAIANEPDGHNVKYSPAELRDLIKTVGAKFTREGIRTKIIAPDLSSPYYDPDKWVAPLLADSVAASYLGAISYHTYYTSGSPDQWNKKFARIAQLAASKNLPVYFTEIGTTPFGIPNTTWPWAFDCMQMWHNALTHGNANLAFQWTLLGKDQALDPDTTRNHIFFAIKQFFSHIRADAVRIAVSSTNNNLLASAFKHTGSNRAQIVLINRSLLSQKVTIKLRNLDVSTFAACRTSATEKHKTLGDAAVLSNEINITIPANAIETLDGAITPSLNLILETRDATLSPAAFNLQAYPNPFHTATQIQFVLPQAAEVKMAILDLDGREVQELITASFAAGEHVVAWDRKNRTGSKLSSGIYFVRLRYRAAQTNAWSQAVQRIIMLN